MGVALNPYDEAGAAARTWTFATCLKCRQLAAVAPSGEVFCQTCMDRTAELVRLLASVARPPAYGCLKSALRGASGLTRPLIAEHGQFAFAEPEEFEAAAAAATSGPAPIAAAASEPAEPKAAAPAANAGKGHSNHTSTGG